MFLSNFLKKMPKFLARIYVLFTVMISFIIFSGENTEQIIENIGGLVGIGNIPIISKESIYYFKNYLAVILVSIIGSTPIFIKIVNNVKFNKIINILEPIFLFLVLLLCSSYIVDGSFNPFLYFRF